MDLMKHNGYYFDTSIWLDLFEKRGVNGEFVIKLAIEILNKNLEICHSEQVIKELKDLGYSSKEIWEILKFSHYCRAKKIHIFKDQREEARRIAKQRKVPLGDALHAIVCRDNDLQLVSTDKDFEKLTDITHFEKPENLLSEFFI
ncbi:PIN domain-containing protein [Candidatus Woesearchaeota archaeon]|nr:PIN domain-containing protein [Candidatus Woesearchaeota archaeon]